MPTAFVGTIFPRLLVGSQFSRTLLAGSQFSALYWLFFFSRRICFISWLDPNFPALSWLDPNFLPYWLFFFFPPYLFYPIFFSAELVESHFPHYWLEPTSCCICWNQFYVTVFVVTMILTKQYMPAASSLCLGDIEYTVIFSYENKLLHKLFSQFS